MRTRREPLYLIWGAMIQRCTNPKAGQYKDYGGRGIRVCDRWRDYKLFAADVGPRPDGLSLDRIDNNRGYEPGNCRWATRLEQNSNKRNCIYVLVVNGERVTLSEYCRRVKLPYRPIVKRIQDRHWPIDVALALPVGRKRDSELIIDLWERYKEIQNYLGVALDAAEGRPVLERILDEARTLCDNTPNIRMEKAA